MCCVGDPMPIFFRIAVYLRAFRISVTQHLDSTPQPATYFRCCSACAQVAWQSTSNKGFILRNRLPLICLTVTTQPSRRSSLGHFPSFAMTTENCVRILIDKCIQYSLSLQSGMTTISSIWHPPNGPDSRPTSIYLLITHSLRNRAAVIWPVNFLPTRKRQAEPED